MNSFPTVHFRQLPIPIDRNHLLLVQIEGKDKEGLTELIARLAVRSPFYTIPGSEWLPDQDSLRTSVELHTIAVDESLDNMRLALPGTCLQLLDLLAEADSKQDLILVLDFLHHFYNSDVDLALRLRVLEQCCQHLKRLALTRPVVVFVRFLPTEEYQDFVSFVSGIADEIICIREDSSVEASQLNLFEESDA